MADSAEFDVIMNGVDNGTVDMVNDLQAAMYESASQADETSKSTEDLGEKTKETGEKSKTAADQFEQQASIMTGLNSVVQLGEKALRMMEQAYGATVAKSQEYSHELRDLMALTDQHVGRTARMVQVLDDYEISTDDVTAAVKKMTANGLSPSIEVLGELSEKYHRLNDPVAKTQFLYDNLGKAGVQWQQVMEAGNETLREKAALVDANLIPSEKELANAEALRIAQDDLNDAFAALSISIGHLATPAVTEFVDAMAKGLAGFGQFTEYLRIMSSLEERQTEILKEKNLYIITGNGAMDQANMQNKAMTQATREQIDAAMEAAKAERGKQAAIEDATTATGNSVASAQAKIESDRLAKEAVDALNATLTTQISLAGTIQSQMDSYSAGLATVSAGQADALVKIQTLIAQGYSPLSTQVMELRDKYSELGTKASELAAQNAEAMAKMRIDNLQAKLAVDGISDADYNLIIAEQLKAGIITQSAADQAVAMNALNTMRAANLISQAEYDKAVSDGSFVVKDSSDKNITASNEQGKAVSKQVDEGKADLDAYNAKVAESATVTESSTTSALVSWNTFGDGVAGVFDSLTAYIDAYNLAMGSLVPPPAIPAGDLRDTPPGAIGARSSGAGGGVVQHRVDIYVNNNYTESVSII